MRLKLIDTALSLVRCCHQFVNADVATFVLMNIIVHIINDTAGFNDVCEEQCLNSCIMVAVVALMLEVFDCEIKKYINLMFVTNARRAQ